MEESTSNITSNELKEIRSLGRWTQRYVQSRSVPVLIGLAVFSVLMVVLMLLWSSAGDAYRADNMPLLIACGVGLAVAHVVLVWLSVPAWGGKRLQRWAWRYYDTEGHVAPEEPISRARMQRLGGIVACVFGGCILAHVAVGLANVVSVEMMFPISALYVVPFLTFLFVVQRVYIMLLYPMLYGVHAAAVAVGLPDPLASFVPVEMRSLAAMVIYGAIAVSVTHVYNRIALSRMARYGRMESK
jgi:hypothetical protein